MDVTACYYDCHKNVLVDGTNGSDYGVGRAREVSYQVGYENNCIQRILKSKVGCSPFLAILDVGLVRIVYDNVEKEKQD